MNGFYLYFVNKRFLVGRCWDFKKLKYISINFISLILQDNVKLSPSLGGPGLPSGKVWDSLPAGARFESYRAHWVFFEGVFLDKTFQSASLVLAISRKCIQKSYLNTFS